MRWMLCILRDRGRDRSGDDHYNPGANGRKHAPSPGQVRVRKADRYALAANTVYRVA